MSFIKKIPYRIEFFSRYIDKQKKISWIINVNKMSHFLSCNDNFYFYVRDGKEYVIAGDLLNTLFKTYGYCVDPSARGGLSLNTSDIEILKEIARSGGDSNLLITIKQVSNGKAPSPRMVNDYIMHETTLNEKHRFDALTCDNKSEMMAILRTILHIGLYLAGWKGDSEPYISEPRYVHDTVRVELKIVPLIKSLYIDTNYPLVKDFPIMRYYHGGSLSSYILKPTVVDTTLNVDRCLNSIELGLNENSIEMAMNLISTAYYYISTICSTPMPMLDKLILSLAG